MMTEVFRLRNIEQAIEQAAKDELSKYEASSQCFFNYLEQLSKDSFNRKQFQIYRDNFFFRTSSTTRSIFRVFLAAALNADYTTRSSIGENLFDELGRGNPEKRHLTLLEKSYNFHGEKVFGLPRISVQEVEQSPFICEEARYFREIQKSLYCHKYYQVVLGCSFAQEAVANHMLESFYKTLFLPYKFLYNEDFEQVSEYFLTHITGLEKNHAEKAKQAIFRACSNEHALQLVVEGISRFLNAQAVLWKGILREMIKAQS